MALEDAPILTEELSAKVPRRDRIRGLPVLPQDLALPAAGSAIYKADYRPLFEQP